jgi:hypothetical protein
MALKISLSRVPVSKTIVRPTKNWQFEYQMLISLKGIYLAITIAVLESGTAGLFPGSSR